MITLAYTFKQYFLLEYQEDYLVLFTSSVLKHVELCVESSHRFSIHETLNLLRILIDYVYISGLICQKCCFFYK